MTGRPLFDRSAHELGDMIRRGEVSCVEVAEVHLDRVDELNDTYGALITRRSRSDVLADATDCDRKSDARRGWLHGVPYAVKDLVDLEGMPTSMGFTHPRQTPDAVRDEPFVARVRGAGAVFLGKSNTPEFGLGSHTFNAIAPPTGNITDPCRSAGGSSGGAAVAVATGMVPVADGSDFMGSLRNPPGWNGVLGFRPSPGVVPSDGDDPSGHGCSTDGPIARTVADLAALLATMAEPGRDLRVDDSPRGPEPRVGWLDDVAGQLPFEPGVLEVCRRAAERWSASLRPVALQPVGSFTGREALWNAWLTTRFDEVGGWLAQTYSDDDIAAMKPEAQWEIEGCRRLAPAARASAHQVRADLRASLARTFADVDLLVLPTAQVWPFDVELRWPDRIAGVAMDTYHRWMEVTTIATLAGLPTAAVPAGVDERGLHIGLQVMGPPGHDRAVLSWVRWAEQRDAFVVTPPSEAVRPTLGSTLAT